MEKNLFKCSLRWVVAAVCLGTTINSTSAGSFTRACATRDLHVLMLIEERESSNAISAEKLSDAVFTMLNARMICNEGRVADALALYDSISQSIISGAVLSGRRRLDGR
jgi:hypothetical protein